MSTVLVNDMSKDHYNAVQQQPVSNSSPLSFTQGFLLGQFSVALLIVFFIKFFIFGEPLPADVRASRRATARHERTLAAQAVRTRNTRRFSSNLHRRPSTHLLNPSRPSTSAGPPLSNADILRKTYYNVNSHQPESLDWFNVLVAQTIAQLRADALHEDAIINSLNDVLNSGYKPSYVGDIGITEIALGEEFPIFSNCRIIPVTDDGGTVGGGPVGAAAALGSSAWNEGKLQARIDVDLNDVITLGVETSIVLNYPRLNTAIMPVALAVSVVRFSGTLSLSFTPSPPSGRPGTSDGFSEPDARFDSGSTTSTGQTLTFTFLDDYRLDLSVRSLLGGRSRLQDVPKIAQLVESRLHAWFDERVVEPMVQQIVLPSLWPRKRNVRPATSTSNLKDDGKGEGKTREPDSVRSSPRKTYLRKEDGTPEQVGKSFSKDRRSDAEEARLQDSARKLALGRDEGLRQRSFAADAEINAGAPSNHGEGYGRSGSISIAGGLTDPVRV